MNDSQALFHLIEKKQWETLSKTKRYYPDTYDQDGFIHATADADLLISVANHFYAGSPGEWLCLETSVARVEATGVKVLFEPAAAVGETPPEIPGVSHDVMFPHIFGGLEPDCIVAVHVVVRDSSGQFMGLGDRA
ncbi:MAG: DUF952 domain-containing protein [Woeseiaceae bacterium]